MVLYELSRLVAQGGDAQANLDQAAGMLADTLRHDVIGIWIAEGGEEKLRLRASRGYGDTLPGDVSIAGQAALLGAFGERRTQRVKLEALRPSWASARSAYYLLAPVISGTQAIGVLVVGRADGSYAEMDLQFTTTLGEYLGGLVQRAASSDELQSVAAGERRRIAQELHDGLAQELTGVVLALEGCQRALERDPDGVPKQLAKAARDARACLADIRQYMTALRQHDGSALTLPVTVSRLVDDLRRTAGLSVEVEKFGAERTLPTQVERSIVRIAQEALHNVSQHAQASKAKVVLHYDDNEVTLTIEDDGQGFAVEPTIEGAEQGGRFGMLGMRERAEGIGGRLHVRSEPGAGTVVQARIPYDAPRLAAVPSWPTAPHPAPSADATPDQGDDADELERRSGFLQRLFGR
jgi:signal transduction histidine kinase